MSLRSEILEATGSFRDSEYFFRPDGTGGQHESFSLTPIPESGRRRALLFSGTGLISSSDDHESKAVVNYSALFDAIVSTITWVKDEDAGGINA